jgi:hypothetical protein
MSTVKQADLMRWFVCRGLFEEWLASWPGHNITAAKRTKIITGLQDDDETRGELLCVKFCTVFLRILCSKFKHETWENAEWETNMRTDEAMKKEFYEYLDHIATCGIGPVRKACEFVISCVEQCENGRYIFNAARYNKHMKQMEEKKEKFEQEFKEHTSDSARAQAQVEIDEQGARIRQTKADVRNMKFEPQRQNAIDQWMQDMPIEMLERKILKDYRGVIVGWKYVLSEKFEMNMSLDTNALCVIACTRAREVDGIIEYEAIVTWPRDKRKEYWQLEYRSNTTSVYGFDFKEVRSREVAATPVTPEYDRYILATYFPKTEAGKTILSHTFQNESFPIDCRWEGHRLCTLHCRKEDIFFPRTVPAIRGATVVDANHILATQENLTVYNLVVKWRRPRPDESWTLQVSWEGYKPKTVIEFKYNGPNSLVTDAKHEGEVSKHQECRIAGLLQRLGEMTTI